MEYESTFTDQIQLPLRRLLAELVVMTVLGESLKLIRSGPILAEILTTIQIGNT